MCAGWPESCLGDALWGSRQPRAKAAYGASVSGFQRCAALIRLPALCASCVGLAVVGGASADVVRCGFGVGGWRRVSRRGVAAGVGVGLGLGEMTFGGK